MSWPPASLTTPRTPGSSRWRRVLLRFFRGGILRRRVVALAWPAVAEQMLQNALGIVDMILVGGIGPAAIAAVGMSDQIVMLVLVSFAAFNVGTTALVARHAGSRDMAAAARVAHQAILVSFGLGTSLGAIAFMAAPRALTLMGAAPDVLVLGTPYFRLMCASIPFLALSVVGNATLRGIGDTRTPLYVAVAVSLLHMTLAFLLIFGHLGLPRLGVVGAGIATLSARTLSGVVTLWVLLSGRSLLQLSFSGLRKWQGETMLRLLRVGLPAAGEQFVMRLGMTLYARIIAGLGTAAFAAHRVALTAESLSFTPGFGFALAAATLVGQGLGARKPRAAEAAGYQTLHYAVAMMSSMGLVFFIFSRPLVLVFTQDPEVVDLASLCLKIVGLAQPVLASSMVMAGALRGAGDTRWTLLITASGIWLLRIPLALLLTNLGLGLPGAWVAMTVDLTIRGALMYWRYRAGRWKSIQI
ncbi:MAG TPA: MATE family efflux transporter [Bacillota bacterium]|nr:MATE family efflux transporter [Bacillota bacterium]